MSALSVKHIDDRNQFILPPPLRQPGRPGLRPWLRQLCGSMSTKEALDSGCRPRSGDLTLPLDNGLKTKATWFTADARSTWRTAGSFRTPRRSCRTTRSGTRSSPANLFTAAGLVTGPRAKAASAFPPGAPFQYFFTNHRRRRRASAPLRHPERSRGAGSISGTSPSPSRRSRTSCSCGGASAKHSLSIGGYFANYYPGEPLELHRHPHRRRGTTRASSTWWSRPPGGSSGRASPGTASGTSSPVYTQRHRSDLDRVRRAGRRDPAHRSASGRSGRAGWSTTTSCRARRTPPPSTLDGDPATTFDNETFGNNSFRHFTRDITDWSGSLGLNYRVNDNFSSVRVGCAGLQDARAR